MTEKKRKIDASLKALLRELLAAPRVALSPASTRVDVIDDAGESQSFSKTVDARYSIQVSARVLDEIGALCE